MTDFATIAEETAAVVSALAPLLGAVSPPAAAAVEVAAKIATGVLAAEPSAVALFDQIKTGAVPTAAQLAQFASDYEAAYQQLRGDLAGGNSA